MGDMSEQAVRPICVHKDGYEHPAITKDGGQSWSTCDHAVLDSARRVVAAGPAAHRVAGDLVSVATVPDVDLDVLLDENSDRTCELWTNHGGRTIRRCRYVLCGRPADWVMHITYPCGHHNPEARFVCDPCRQIRIAGGGCGCGFVASDGYYCATEVTVRWTERIR